MGDLGLVVGGGAVSVGVDVVRIMFINVMGFVSYASSIACICRLNASAAADGFAFVLRCFCWRSCRWDGWWVGEIVFGDVVFGLFAFFLAASVDGLRLLMIGGEGGSMVLVGAICGGSMVAVFWAGRN